MKILRKNLLLKMHSKSTLLLNAILKKTVRSNVIGWGKERHMVSQYYSLFWTFSWDEYVTGSKFSIISRALFGTLLPFGGTKDVFPLHFISCSRNASKSNNEWTAEVNPPSTSYCFCSLPKAAIMTLNIPGF